MVGDNTKRNIVIIIFVIFNACNFHDVLHGVLNSVNLKEVVNTLHYTSKSLKTHTGIDIWLCKASVIIMSVIFKLSENKVPNLNKAVTFAAYLTIRAAAALINTTVKINLGARAARTCTMLPEVVFLTKTNHM